MNKEDLAEIVSKKINIHKDDTKQVLKVILKTITQTLVSGDRVELRGLGSFEVRHRKSRKGRIFSTGEIVPISSRKSPVFIPGRIIKQMVNAR